MSIAIPSHLSDDELMISAAGIAGDERAVVARLIACLAEIDRRRLYAPAGYASLFSYCHEGLGYSEDAAYNRKVAAQVARRYPAILDMLADGRLNLTAVRLLAPVLHDGNREAVFAEAAGRTKRDIERLVVRLAPKPDVPPTVRRVAAAGSPAAAGPAAVPERQEPNEDVAQPAVLTVPPVAPVERRPVVAPLAPERYRVQFTIGEETEKKLRRLQELLKREVPDGDPAAIFDRALTLLLEKTEARKLGQASAPRDGRARRARTRTMPAAVRRAVVPRDGGRCTFVAADGRRCTERAYLEFHHGGVPFAHGGPPTPGNITLHCRVHNGYEAERVFGRRLPPEVKEARAVYDAMRFPSSAVPERRGM